MFESNNEILMYATSYTITKIMAFFFNFIHIIFYTPPVMQGIFPLKEKVAKSILTFHQNTLHNRE